MNEEEEKKTMGKYADLEQALRDPSLAIISDQITTLSELNRVYFK